MDRRAFLLGSATLTAILPSITRAAPKAIFASEDMAQHFIWSETSTPVPVIGDADSIKDGKIKIATGDVTLVDQQAVYAASFDVTAEDFHSVFVKTFSVAVPPKAAPLHIFAYSRYRLYINDQYIARGPSRFELKRPEYDTHDIANVLKPGMNSIRVLVHAEAPSGRIRWHAPGLTVELDLGAGRIIRTDGTWKAEQDASFGPRDAAWSSIDEAIDARRDPLVAPGGLNNWKNARPLPPANGVKLFPRTVALLREAVRPWQSLPAFPLTLSAGQSLTLEADEIVLAYHKLRFEATEGSALEVHYMLPEETNNGVNRYVTRGGEQTYEGGDTFAFKTLTLKVLSGCITLFDVSAVEVLYPFDQLGEFECSDPYLGHLWRICTRSLQILSEDSWIDCADRERVEWMDNTPPAFEVARVSMATRDPDGTMRYADPRLLKAIIRRIGLTQQGDGQLKAHSCSERWDIHAIMEDRSCDWVIALRQYFEATGDKAFVREQWPVLKGVLAWFLSKRTPRGLVEAREWETWDNPLRYQVCEGTGLNAFVYKALTDAAYLGKEVGFTDDAKIHAAAAAALKSAINTHLWDESAGTYYGALFGPASRITKLLFGRVFDGPIVDGHYQPTLQATLFAREFGLVPEDRQSRVTSWMLAHLAEATLPMSLHFLLGQLAELNRPDLDTWILNSMRERWTPVVASPWQTTWEAFGGGSKLHIYGVLPAYHLSAYTLGVRLDGHVRRQRLRISPHLGDLTFARGNVVTEFGIVPIAWELMNDTLKIDFTLPENVKAKVTLPSGFTFSTLTRNGRLSLHRGGSQTRLSAGNYSVTAERHMVAT